MSRPTEAADLEALTEAILDALEADAEARGNAFDREVADPGITAIAQGVVTWVRTRETEELEIDTSDLSVTISGVPYPVDGVATIT